MSPLSWIIVSGIAMSAIALVGGLTVFMKPETLERVLLPLVALAAGSLIGGAFFHMIPGALGAGMDALSMGVATVAGFTAFFFLEQILHWHHCHHPERTDKQPLTYLVLLGDGLHNFLGGMAIGGTFLIDTRLGITSWLAAAAHEVPQELGDFGVLVKGGWSGKRALFFNMISGLTFLAGGLVAYTMSHQVNITWLIPFAAGNFLYIGASDLVPEVNKEGGSSASYIHLSAFLAGVLLLLVTRLLFDVG